MLVAWFVTPRPGKTSTYQFQTKRLLRWHNRFISSKPKSAKSLFSFSYTDLTASFHAALQHLRLSKQGYRLHSLRHGGSTFEWLSNSPLQDVMMKGRWEAESQTISKRRKSIDRSERALFTLSINDRTIRLALASDSSGGKRGVAPRTADNFSLRQQWGEKLAPVPMAAHPHGELSTSRGRHLRYPAGSRALSTGFTGPWFKKIWIFVNLINLTKIQNSFADSTSFLRRYWNDPAGSFKRTGGHADYRNWLIMYNSENIADRQQQRRTLPKTTTDSCWCSWHLFRGDSFSSLLNVNKANVLLTSLIASRLNSNLPSFYSDGYRKVTNHLVWHDRYSMCAHLSHLRLFFLWLVMLVHWYNDTSNDTSL